MDSNDTTTELMDERGHKIKSARDLISAAKKEDRPLTADEQKSFDEQMAEADQLGAVIKEREQTAVREAQLEAKETEIQADHKSVRLGIGPDRETNDRDPEAIRIAVKMRTNKMKMFPDTVEGRRNAYISGAWVRAAFMKDGKAQRWCKNNGVEYRALGGSTFTAGGALIPDEMMQAIIDNRETYGVFRRNCRVIPMGRDVMTVPALVSGSTATFTDENAAGTESDAVWTNISLTAKKLMVITRISSELDEDAVIDLGDFVAADFAQAFALKEDQCGFLGAGGSTHGGITGIITKYEADNSLAAVNDGTSSTSLVYSTVPLTDLTGTMGLLPQYADPGAKWYMSRVAQFSILGRLAAVAGGNTIQTMTGAFGASFLGYPIEVSQVMPTSSANDKVIFMFGDLTKVAAMGSRREITVRLSEDRYFEQDQIALKATERIDIAVHSLGDGTTAGGMTALVATT